MSDILTDIPFPWSDPRAKALYGMLCDIYPTSSGAIYVALDAGLPRAILNGEQPAARLWREILIAGAVAVVNRRIVEIVRDENPRNPKVGFLDSLLDPTKPTVLPEANERSSAGQPKFIHGDDTVLKDESLLFHDDLTMPIGRIPWLIEVLGRLQKLAPSICRLKVESAAGSGQWGTAFRIAPALLLTNWHVLKSPKIPADKVTAAFFYDSDAPGAIAQAKEVPCDTSFIHGDANDDWAVIRTAGTIPADVPVVPMTGGVIPQVMGETFIVQHPGGQSKRVAFVRNRITFVDDRVIQYLSDTQGGSSGSPVVNEKGELLGIHRAGGRPQEVAGSLPIKKNEGVRISRIISGLSQQNISLH